MKKFRSLSFIFLFTLIILSFAAVSVSADDDLLPGETAPAESGTETPVQVLGSISDLTFSGNTASVTYQANVSASVIAAVYDETSGEMLASGTINAAPSASSQTDSIQMNLSAEEMPARFYAKAFLVDRYTNYPLCEAYATERYTTTVQSLLSDSLDNYSDLPSIDLGEGNFVAFSDDVTVINTSSVQNKVTHQADGSWLFENPDDTLQNLSNGDTVSFTDADETVQMGTVSALSDLGSGVGSGMTLEITPDPNRASKIAALRFTAKYTGNPDHGNAFTYLSELDIHANPSLAAGLSGKVGIVEGEISGGFNLDIKHQPDVSCIIAWNKNSSYIDLSYASENQLSVEAEGKGSLSITPFTIPLPVKDLVDITVGPKFSLELSSGVEWNSAWAHAARCTIVDGHIMPANENPVFHPVDSSVKLNGELSFSIFGGLDISALDGDLLKTTFGAECKASVSGEKTPYVPETSDGAYHHLCNDCISGQLGISVTGKAELNLWSNESMSMKLSTDEEIRSTEPVYFYTCNTHGISEMNKSCPYYTWRVKLQMLDAEGSPLPNVDVINAATNQPAGKTDGSGWFTTYLPNGEYDFYVPYGSKERFHVRVSQEPKVMICETDIIKGSCGVNLNYEVLGDTLYITGSGSMYDYSSGNAPWYPYAKRIEEVVFPDELTSIGDYAFYKMNKLTKVIIPDKVETIGASAFRQCEKLEGVDLPEELRTVKSYAFYNCIQMTDILVFPEKNDITIQSNAFNRLIRMYKTLNIPDNVVWIGDYAFDSYGDFAESGGGILNLGTEESRLTHIGKCAFYKTCFTGGITIPDSVTYVGDMAFQGMESANGSLKISKNLTRINEGAFSRSAFSGAVQIPDAVETISGSAFIHCSNITSVTLNEGLTHIFDSAFQFCDGLNGTLTIPSSVTYLGTYAFDSCKNISRIVMENGTEPKTIGSWCFSGSSKGSALNEVVFADTVTKIGDFSFAYNAGLTAVNLPDSVTVIDDDAFIGTGLTGTLVLPASLKTIGKAAFEGLTTLTEIVFPDQLETIENYAFKGCTGLSSLSLPDSLTEIELEAFADCSGLTGELILPDHITSIGISAFMYTNITDIHMPSRLKTYGRSMFWNNHSLSNIYIKGTPDNINGIYGWIGDYTGTVYYPEDSSFWASEKAQLECNSSGGNTVNATWVPYNPATGKESESVKPASSALVPADEATPDYDSAEEINPGSDPANITNPSSDSSNGTDSVSDSANGNDSASDSAEGTSPAPGTVDEANPAADSSDAADAPVDESGNNDAAETNADENNTGENDTDSNTIQNTEEEQSADPAMEILPADAVSAEMTAGFIKPKRLQGVFASYTPASANTASFADRWPGQAYLFVIVKDKNAEDLFAADNLLFIDQKQADSSGALSFGYTLPSSSGDCEQVLYGTDCIPLKNAKVSVSNATYSGSALTPTVTVKLNNVTLTENLHYTVAYKDNILPGTATVTVTGIAPYYGTATGTFTIQKKQPVFTASGFTVTSSDKPQTKKLSVTVTEGGPVSYSTTSSQITVDQNGNVTIPANYVGSGTIKVTCAENKYYTSKTISVTVRSTAAQNPPSGDSGSDNPGGSGSDTPGGSGNQDGPGSSGSSESSGTAGNPSGSVDGTVSGSGTEDQGVTVKWLKAPKLKSVKNTGSRKLTVKWKKNKKAAGYEIQYARKKDFSDAKSKLINKSSKTKAVLKKLKKGKKYYVRIRSFRKVGDICYYSEFGKVKKVKIRK